MFISVFISIGGTARNSSNNNLSDKFASKIGFLLASAGSAIGLGTIWRYPYMVSENGHGAFIIMYLICVILIGMPLVLAEYVIGKYSVIKGNNIGLINIWKTYSNNKWVYSISYLFILTNWVIYTYYMIIFGWVFVYFFKTLFGSISYSTADISYYETLLENLFNNNLQVILATLLASLITALISIRGVSKGIEKLTLIGMPTLFIILLIIIVRVITLDGAFEGFKYYISFTSSDFTLKRLFAAISQAFYALSLGLGILMTYASYSKKEVNLLNTTFNTVLITSVIAFLVGVMIIPSLFIFGFDNVLGPGLIFVSLPAVFSKIYGGYFFALLFFSLIIIVAIIATLSMLEVITPAVMSLLKIRRTTAVILVSSSAMIVSIFQILSFNCLSNFTIFGRRLFNFFDYFASSILLPIGAILTCILVGYIIKNGIISKLQLEDPRIWIKKFKVYEIWFYWIKFVVPIIIFILLIISLR